MCNFFLHICKVFEKKSFFRKLFFVTGFVFERFLAPRSRSFEKVNGLGVLGPIFSGVLCVRTPCRPAHLQGRAYFRYHIKQKSQQNKLNLGECVREYRSIGDREKENVFDADEVYWRSRKGNNNFGGGLMCSQVNRKKKTDDHVKSTFGSTTN
ncbi:hypothetical protein LXL04_015441 [Taraxacum kok-saghyz]